MAASLRPKEKDEDAIIIKKEEGEIFDQMTKNLKDKINIEKLGVKVKNFTTKGGDEVKDFQELRSSFTIKKGSKMTISVKGLDAPATEEKILEADERTTSVSQRITEGGRI